MTTPIVVDPISAGSPLPAPTTPAPEAVVPAPPAVVPAATPPKPVETPATAVPDPERRALEAELAFYRRKAAEGELAEKAQTYQNQLEADGWPVELARVQAKTWAERESLTRQVADFDGERQATAKREVISILSQEFGVPAHLLAGYNSPDAMVAAARHLSDNSKRLTAMEAELASLKGGTVPAQTFEPGKGGAAASDAAFILQYGDGKSNDHARAKKLLGM